MLRQLNEKTNDTTWLAKLLIKMSMELRAKLYFIYVHFEIHQFKCRAPKCPSKIYVTLRYTKQLIILQYLD